MLAITLCPPVHIVVIPNAPLLCYTMIPSVLQAINHPITSRYKNPRATEHNSNLTSLKPRHDSFIFPFFYPPSDICSSSRKWSWGRTLTVRSEEMGGWCWCWCHVEGVCIWTVSANSFKCIRRIALTGPSQYEQVVPVWCMCWRPGVGKMTEWW